MNHKVMEEIIAKSDLLSSEEQQQIIAVLTEKVQKSARMQVKPPRKWLDMVGRLPYPACGEDAQIHISRNRRETNNHRENSNRDQP
ncbi:MAG: hypothetical protein AB1656_07975 [Candidatus Omnitrophota bacterium]